MCRLRTLDPAQFPAHPFCNLPWLQPPPLAAQIFVGGASIGGCDALLAFLPDGSFERSLQQAAGRPALPAELLQLYETGLEVNTVVLLPLLGLSQSIAACTQAY